MKQDTVELKIAPSKFKPTGLLLLTTGAIGLVQSATNAIGGALGLGEAFPGPPPVKVRVLTATTDKDRIVALGEDLTKAFQASALFSFDWLGQSWSDYILTDVQYTRAAGRILGVFALSLTRVKFVKTAQAQTLQIPAELSMKPIIPAGNKPGKALTGAAKSTTKDLLPPPGPTS
jgi:hypothetical protein